ncbi:copy number control protein CopB [Microseira wollei NIES-4236]|uniref:Copy number control protein CopB n=2 Tax=Microseira wollei TaxID=467598 RepID=A0AAV3X9F3_9CYAN|nr:copy number control protein CopB [Microseira wollei NIES-4236]
METQTRAAMSLCKNLDMTKETTMHVVIPTDLKKEFKSTCVLEGVNMSQVVCELIQDWLSQRKAKTDESNKSSKS